MATVRWRPWRGDEVLATMRKRAAGALNEAGADGVVFVQERWPRDTGFSANTMEVVEQATPDNLRVSWGNITADYAIWIEIGARGRPGRHILARSLEAMAGTMGKRLQS